MEQRGRRRRCAVVQFQYEVSRAPTQRARHSRLPRTRSTTRTRKFPVLELVDPELCCTFTEVMRPESSEWPKLYVTSVSGRDHLTAGFSVQVLSPRDKYEVVRDVEFDGLLVDFSGSSFSELHDSGGDEFDVRVSVHVFELPAYQSATSCSSMEDGRLVGDLGTEFRLLLNSGLCSDVTLRIRDPGKSRIATYLRGATMRAHKAILCARSPVFAKLLTTNTEEALTGVVLVQFPMDAVRAMLEYMYSGHADICRDKDANMEVEGAADDDSTTLILDVLAAADYYAVDGLHQQCERVLVDRLSAENSLCMLVLADQYGALTLKTKAIAIVARHLKEVQCSPEWKTFVHKRSDLVEEVLAHLGEAIAVMDLRCWEASELTLSILTRAGLGQHSTERQDVAGLGSNTFFKRCEHFFVALPGNFVSFMERHLLLDRGAFDGTRHGRERSRPL